MKHLIAFLLVTLALGCSKTTSPQYQYIRDKAVVVVVEEGGKITDVRLFDKASEANVRLKQDKELSLIALGANVLSGRYGARAIGKSVSIEPSNGTINAIGRSLNFRIEINDELLSRIHTFLSNKPLDATR